MKNKFTAWIVERYVKLAKAAEEERWKEERSEKSRFNKESGCKRKSQARDSVFEGEEKEEVGGLKIKNEIPHLGYIRCGISLNKTGCLSQIWLWLTENGWEAS